MDARGRSRIILNMDSANTMKSRLKDFLKDLDNIKETVIEGETERLATYVFQQKSIPKHAFKNQAVYNYYLLIAGVSRLCRGKGGTLWTFDKMLVVNS